jgi:hypothetical protein
MMTPGAIEEVGKVATGTIEALRNQPLVLALVLLQALVLAAVLYSSIVRQTSVDVQFKHVFELLEKCMKQNNAP